MSRMDAQARIIQNLAMIRYQLEDLSRAGMYRSRFTEDLAQRTLQAVASRPVINLNSESNNFPGIDLRSEDETVGYQVTRHVTKAKYDKTATGVAAELAKNDSRVKHLKDVYVVGLTSVNNAIIRRWAAINSTHDTRIRAIELQSLLDFASMTDETMLGVDDVIQSFVHNWGRPLRADAVEVRTIVGWLDRPAIRDIRVPEMDWYDMAAAMKGLRRLLAQGVDDHGRPVTRPISSFRDPYDLLLKKIFRASHSISSMLTPRLRLGEDPTVIEVNHINGYRLEIQDNVTIICGIAGLTPPRW